MVPTPDPRAVRGALRSALDADPRPRAAGGDRLAAVLVPLIEAPRPSLVFTRRAADLSRHAGEISFPGGLQDPGETLAETALREAREEVDLDPAAVELLGALPSVHTHVSAILVVPFVGMLASPPVLTHSEGEIAEVLTFPIGRLDGAESAMELARDGGRVWRGWAYELEGSLIWGATGKMLHDLLEVLRKETPWLSKEP
jgi:8-oxo-dGTP pyrophosphatase MutT (NUDIX family)